MGIYDDWFGELEKQKGLYGLLRDLVQDD